MSEDWLPSESSQKSPNRKLIWGAAVMLSVMSLCTGAYLSQTNQNVHSERKPALGEYRFLFDSQALQPNGSALKLSKSRQKSRIYKQGVESETQRNLLNSNHILSTGQLISTSSKVAPEPNKLDLGEREDLIIAKKKAELEAEIQRRADAEKLRLEAERLDKEKLRFEAERRAAEERRLDKEKLRLEAERQVAEKRRLDKEKRRLEAERQAAENDVLKQSVKRKPNDERN